MPRSMGRELDALRAGEMTEDEFARATAGHWAAIAARLVGRWEVPPAIDAEDARQELLLALVEQGLVGKWDPERQVPLSRFVVWTTCASAKAWLHQQRGALRHRGTARSRFPLSEAASTRRGRDGELEPSPLGRAVYEGSDPETQAGAREVVSAILALAPTRRARTALLALLAVGGRVEVAAGLIFADAKLALDCGVGSRREARAVVREAMCAAREIARE